MNILMVSTHVYSSRRRASFHWIADTLARAGHQISFVTTGLSLLSYLKKDYRLNEEGMSGTSSISISEYPIVTAFHPINLRAKMANKLIAPLWRLYPLQFYRLIESISEPDLIIIESGSSVALAKSISRKFPRAAMIYRVSDLLKTMSVHPYLEEEERSAFPLFSLISVPSKVMLSELPYHRNARLQPHGLQIDALESVTDKSPFAAGTKNVVCVGTMLFDAVAVRAAAENLPDVDFHIFGNTAIEPTKNLHLYGEVKYIDTLPYIKHCSAGLAPYRRSMSGSYLADTSNKMMLFRYFRRPIVAPGFVCTESWMSPYDESASTDIVRAVGQALVLDISEISVTKFESWEDVVDKMLSSSLVDAGTLT